MASLVIVSILVAGSLVAVVFSGVFFGKLVSDNYRQKKENAPVRTVKAADQKKEEVEELDLDQMLAELEARAKENEKDVVEEEPVEEPAEEPAVNQPEELPEFEDIQAEETIPEEPEEEVVEEVEEEKEQPVDAEKEVELDYEARLAKAKEAFEKLEKDYQKNTKSLNKYNRTERKKEKNERLLNKKAAELASLNLSVYNVKELADVDPEKKAKQEELTTHVAELKAAIVEAEEYLEANLEKHKQEVKLGKYLEKEHARYEEEIRSLEEFLNKKDSDTEE